MVLSQLFLRHYRKVVGSYPCQSTGTRIGGKLFKSPKMVQSEVLSLIECFIALFTGQDSNQGPLRTVVKKCSHQAKRNFLETKSAEN